VHPTTALAASPPVTNGPEFLPPACVHCKRRQANANRGLCRRCYNNVEAIRNQYPPRDPSIPRPPCRHCSRPASRPRRLCTTCYYDSSLRQRYGPIGPRGHRSPLPADHYGGHRLAVAPTPALPGSPAKLEVIRSRLMAGVSPWHPEDGGAEGVAVAYRQLAELVLGGPIRVIEDAPVPVPDDDPAAERAARAAIDKRLEEEKQAYRRAAQVKTIFDIEDRAYQWTVRSGPAGQDLRAALVAFVQAIDRPSEVWFWHGREERTLVRPRPAAKPAPLTAKRQALLELARRRQQARETSSRQQARQQDECLAACAC
jgi:hypothetical protein